MARIKIKDLPKDMKISKKEMKNITGGGIIIIGRQHRFGGFSLRPKPPSERSIQKL